jgi:transposase-like protein
METILEMRTRHKQERIELMFEAVRSTGTVSGAARILGTDRSVIYRELNEAGLSVPNQDRIEEARSEPTPSDQQGNQSA